jgi:hypothetical protein
VFVLQDSDDEDGAADAPKMAGSMNPFASLMKQYDELTALIANIQTTMDNVATVCEQILGVLTWREPRVTFVTAAVSRRRRSRFIRVALHRGVDAVHRVARG